MLAQQYCNECKTSFEELSKIIQRVLVSRKELISYDSKHKDMDAPQVAVRHALLSFSNSLENTSFFRLTKTNYTYQSPSIDATVVRRRQ